VQLDRKLESWKVGSMKMTLDLPSELVREMKLRAALEGRKLRDVATEIFRGGLSQSAPQSESARHRVKLPLITCRNVSQELSPERVAEVLLNQEVAWNHEAARH
jgi:plasmid stability protein